MHLRNLFFLQVLLTYWGGGAKRVSKHLSHKNNQCFSILKADYASPKNVINN